MRDAIKPENEIWIVYCPQHVDQKIGAVKYLYGGEVGFWCRKCKEYKFFNEKNIKIPFTLKENYKKIAITNN